MHYLILNWKMNPVSIQKSKELFVLIEKKASLLKRIRVAIAPPLVFLSALSEFKKENKMKKIVLVSQNTFWLDRGSYTGETSPLMLKDLDVNFVLVGHSERRIFFAESEEMINKKMKASLNNNLKVILCIGERERREGNQFRKEIFTQLNYALRGINKREAKNILIAYEPIWAIGTGQQPEREKVEKTALLIRKWLEVRFSEKQSRRIPILYGGSIKGANIKNYFSLKNINGVLIGRASTRKNELLSIFKKLTPTP